MIAVYTLLFEEDVASLEQVATEEVKQFFGKDSIATPFGWFHKKHVHDHPNGSKVTKNTDGTHTVTNPDGTQKNLTAATTKTPDKNRFAAKGLPIKHAWLNYASFYVPEGIEVGTFTATYQVPAQPTGINAETTLYYFIGVQDNGSSPLAILQPVLAWNGKDAKEAWSLASWNCCPQGQVVKSKVLKGMKSGDLITTSIEREGDEYTISGTWNNQSATITVKTGEEFFNWANIALEVYDVKSCDNFAVGPMVFSALTMKDTKDNPIEMNWTITGNGVACDTRMEQKANSMIVQQN